MTDSPDLTAVDRPVELAIDPAALTVLETLWARGHAALVVGGAVRDLLLGIATTDWDVATDARPERVLEIFPAGVYENRFGTVSVGDVQITTFRRDHRYADHRRPEFVTFTDDAFQDLARRDLTINAIAWGRIRPGSAAQRIDPADGVADLRAGIVRAVGDPDARFDEDALRMLRAVRIAAQLGFRVEPRTLRAIRDHAGDVAWVSEERIGTELRLMLAASQPSVAFRLLHETGMLAAILPEIPTRLAEIDGVDSWLARLDAVAAGARGRERLLLAALVGDLTQPELSEPVVARLRVGQREASAVARIVAAAREPYSAGWSDADVRRYIARTRPELIDDALALRLALAGVEDSGPEKGGGPEPGSAAELRARSLAQVAARAPLSLADLAIDGDDLRAELDIPEGPLVGELLARALEAVIEEPSRNDRETLLGLVRGWHRHAIG